jgi:hypothetical protein
MTVKPDKAKTYVRSTHSFSILPRSILIRDYYNPDRVAKMALLKTSRSKESIPTGAMKNNWNRNLSRAMITIIATMIMIM